MPRRKITEEAEEGQQSNDNADEADRQELTQRMPPNLVDDVDDWAETMGISSRNTAINMLVRQSLPDD